MRELININRIRSIIKDKKGESIMESIVTLLVFAILMAAVSMMLKTSLIVTDISTQEATIRQENANNALLGAAPEEGVLSLECSSGASSTTFEIDIPVEVSLEEDGFIAFSPEETP